MCLLKNFIDYKKLKFTCYTNKSNTITLIMSRAVQISQR